MKNNEKKKVELSFVSNDLVNCCVRMDTCDKNSIAERTRSRFSSPPTSHTPRTPRGRLTPGLSTQTSKRGRHLTPSSKITPSPIVTTPKRTRGSSCKKPQSRRKLVKDSPSANNAYKSDGGSRAVSPESPPNTDKIAPKVTPMKIIKRQFVIRSPASNRSSHLGNDIANIIMRSPPLRKLDVSEGEIFIESPRKKNTSQKENVVVSSTTPKLSKPMTLFTNDGNTPKTTSSKKTRKSMISTPSTARSLRNKFSAFDTPKERRKEIRKGIQNKKLIEEKVEIDNWNLKEISETEFTCDDSSNQSQESHGLSKPKNASFKTTILEKQARTRNGKERVYRPEEDPSTEESEEDYAAESKKSATPETRIQKKSGEHLRRTARNTISKCFNFKESSSEEELETGSEVICANELNGNDEEWKAISRTRSSRKRGNISRFTSKATTSRTRSSKIQNKNQTKVQTEEMSSEGETEIAKSDEDFEESEESEGDDETVPAKKSALSASYKIQSQEKLDYHPIMLDSEKYFEKRFQKSVSSKNTLSDLRIPDLSECDMNKLIEKNYVKHDVKKLTENYRNQFEKWLYYLREGFNLVMYGVGSKINVMKLFHKEALEDQYVVTANGYEPDFSLNDLFTVLLVDIFHKTHCPTNLYEALAAAEEALLKNKFHVFIMINNIDGVPLRGNKQQTILSKLAKLPYVHIIATIDHINAPLLWSNSKKTAFNFLWLDVTTFCPYTVEIGAGNSLEICNLGLDSSLTTLTDIFKTMDPKTQELFKFIVKCYLDNSVKKDFKGILVSDLLRLAKSKFTVSSTYALKKNLDSMKKYDFISWENSFINILIKKNVLTMFYKQQFAGNGL